MALFPTKKISALSPFTAPLTGFEEFECVQGGNSRKVTSRDFVLPTDSLITLTGMGGSLPGSRQVVDSATIQIIDNGPGSTVTFNALIAGALPGNPTALVGLAPVNGVAVTWMRSDSAPALDQAIIPNWTGQHVFHRNSTGLFYGIRAHSANPLIGYLEEDAAANNQLWDLGASGEQFIGRVRSDDGLTNTTWLAVDRTGTTVDLINLQATVAQVNGQNIRDAAILTSGTIATARLGAGVADATTWLRGDQSWQTLPGSFSGFANPTASVGLAAVNGAATTAMRSDAAPALSQSIAPTWTAQHIFSLSGATNAAILASSAQPQVDWNETDGAANNRRWRLEAQGEQFLGRTVNDANSAAVTWLAVDRTLNVVDTIALTSTALTWNGNPISTAVGANPTASVGLAAVNGVAATFMRSDGAPALSQSIAPTWTAQHIFSLSGLSTPAILLSSAAPTQIWNETDAAADNRRWYVQADGETMKFGAVNDASSISNDFMTVDRTGAVIDSVTFPAQVLCTNAGPGLVVQRTTGASMRINETAAAANNRIWDIALASEQLMFRILNDAVSTITNWMQVDRTGTTVDLVGFPNGTVRIGNNQTETISSSPLQVGVNGVGGIGIRNCTADVEALVQAGATAFEIGTRTAHQIDVYTGNSLRFSFANAAPTTGASTPTLSANKPGANAGVIAWISVLTSAGTQGWVPLFGN